MSLLLPSRNSERLYRSGDGHRDCRAGRCFGCRDPTTKLPRQRLDDTRTKSASHGSVSQVAADSHTIIRDREPPRRRARLKPHDDRALGPTGECVLERIYDKLCGDQAHADRLFGGRGTLAGFDSD